LVNYLFYHKPNCTFGSPTNISQVNEPNRGFNADENARPDVSKQLVQPFNLLWSLNFGNNQRIKLGETSTQFTNVLLEDAYR
jgi:hypothetical protein